MSELLFLVGAIIGALVSYFFLQYKYQHFRGNEDGLLERLEKAEMQNRELGAQLSQCKGQVEKLRGFEVQVQQQAEDLRTVTDTLASAEQQIAALQEQLASAERAEALVDEEAPQQDIIEESQQIEETSAPEPPEESPSVEEASASEDEYLAEEPVAQVEGFVTAEVSDEGARSIKTDDLRKIEGIGPKVAGILHDAGVMTFDQLAHTEVSFLRTVLEKAGPSFKGMTPESWPDQAGLAAKGDWEALKSLQDRLDGGRYKVSS